MNRVANICKTTEQRGNALVLLLLLKTWDGAEPPDHYELAALAHISARQCERDLLKLAAEGEAERISPEHHGGRGCKTRWRVCTQTARAQTTSDMSESDKTPSDVAEFKGIETPTHPSEIPETTTDMAGLSDSISDTSVVDTTENYDTSAHPPTPPYKDKELLSKSLANARSPRAREAEARGEGRELTFSDYRAYAKSQPRLHAPDAWAGTHFDLRDRDELVSEWLDAGKGKATNPATPPVNLTPEELQERVNAAAVMLNAGHTLPEIRERIGAGVRQSQWAQIASAARAQAKPPKLDTAGESPPARATNVVRLRASN